MEPEKPQKRKSLRVRVLEFFRDNPTEELTHQLLYAKFGCPKWTAVGVIRELVADGVLESVHVIRLRSAGIAKD